MIQKLFIGALLAFSLIACSETEFKTVEQKYDNAVELLDNGRYAQASPILQEVIDENPGTRYATFAHLKMGDSWMETGEDKDSFNSAEVQYRLFLANAQGTHLAPYVMSRLIELNYRRNVSSLFKDSYAYSRDPEHFHKIVTEYQRFFLLYPQSLYLPDAKVYMEKSINALAHHELLIGDWYFDHLLYPSAIARYTYTLENYPNLVQRREVLLKLIEAYRKNQQPMRADEMERVYRLNFGGENEKG